MDYYLDWSAEGLCSIFVLMLSTFTVVFIIERWWHLGSLRRLGFTGPSPNLILGTIRDFSKVSGEFPDGWQELFDTYGSQVGDVKGKCLAMYMGRLPCVVVSDPDLIKVIAIRDFENFRNRMFSEVGKNKGMLAARDSSWRNARHTIAPAFSHAKIKHMSSALNKSLSIAFDTINDHIKDNKPVDFLKVYRGLTMEVICKFCLAVDVNAQGDEKHPLSLSAIKIFEDYGYANIKRLLTTLFPSLSTIIVKAFGLSNTPCEKTVLRYVKKAIDQRMASNKMGKTVDALYFMLEAAELIGAEEEEAISKNENHTVVSNGWNKGLDKSKNVSYINGVTKAKENNSNHLQNNRKLQKESSEAPPVDLENKSKMPKLTAEDVAAHAFVLLLAGYETTSAALTFTSYLLAKHPDVQQRLYEEISENIKSEDELTNEAVSQLQYLDMVVNESLRYYPPAASIVTREVDKDYEHKGVHFPAKSYILIPIGHMHYNRDLWKNPKTFDPERFHPDRKREIHPAAFMPFGLGPRKCMGDRFALMEIKHSIIKLLSRFRLEFCDLTEKDLKTRASMLILTPASGHMYLRCFPR